MKVQVYRIWSCAWEYTYMQNAKYVQCTCIVHAWTHMHTNCKHTYTQIRMYMMLCILTCAHTAYIHIILFLHTMQPIARHCNSTYITRRVIYLLYDGILYASDLHACSPLLPAANHEKQRWNKMASLSYVLDNSGIQGSMLISTAGCFLSETLPSTC